MIIHFKVIPESKNNEWLGWFGDDVIKVRLMCKKENAATALVEFLHNNLGMRKEDIVFTRTPNSKLITLNLPDTAWELLWSVISD